MRRRWIVGSVLFLFCATFAVWVSIRPSLEREWAPDQARQPRTVFDGTRLHITNVRNFDHCPDSGSTIERWEERTFDLDELESVWMVLSLFKKDWRGPAHPFLSFGFADSTYLSVSVEARREVGETYSIWKGISKRFELTYVVAVEPDVLKLRTLCHDDRVFLYPLDISPEKGRQMLSEMLKRANSLGEKAEFYHTVFSNCTTEIIARANTIATIRIPGGVHSFLPGYSDKVVHSLGLIDASGSIEDVRARFQVNDRAMMIGDDPRFSIRIREGSP
ncbi:MAG: DUF4105 domain-containing protein [Candidatus Krumholzibacteria bacterium]|nr:DUF4105 domain-containing protein [Candidatus Krumholzibacteria bacterium]